LRRVFKAWQSQLPNLPKTIQNCKDIILFLDVLEEHSDLLLEEWNFRNLVSQQLQDLLHLQKNYWKQRGTIKWVNLEMSALGSSMQMLLLSITGIPSPLLGVLMDLS
jgi:hypothetical protein